MKASIKKQMRARDDEDKMIRHIRIVTARRGTRCHEFQEVRARARASPVEATFRSRELCYPNMHAAAADVPCWDHSW